MLFHLTGSHIPSRACAHARVCVRACVCLVLRITGHHTCYKSGATFPGPRFQALKCGHFVSGFHCVCAATCCFSFYTSRVTFVFSLIRQVHNKTIQQINKFWMFILGKHSNHWSSSKENRSVHFDLDCFKCALIC